MSRTLKQAAASGATPLPTRERLIRAAMALFREKGYCASGMAEILASAGVNSGSFYHFFRSKDDLLAAVLDRYQEILHPVLLAPIWKATSDPIERVFGLLDRYRELIVSTQFTYGCPIGRLALEIDPALEEVRSRLVGNFDAWTAAVEGCLNDAQAVGRLPMRVDAKRLARFVLTVMEGGVMLSRSHASVESFDIAVDQLRQHIDALTSAGTRRTRARAKNSTRKRQT